jgi:signal transduction histidine kinase
MSSDRIPPNFKRPLSSSPLQNIDIASTDTASIDIASIDIASVDIASIDIASIDIASVDSSPLEPAISPLSLLQPMGMQVGMAARCVELHQRIRADRQPDQAAPDQAALDQATELQSSGEFAALVGRMIEIIQDGLNVAEILPAIAQDLAQVLRLDRCQIDLYDASCTTATTAYEYATQLPVCQHWVREIADFPELYQPLFRQQPVQFGERIPLLNPRLLKVTRLGCPIFDQQGILGNLWLFKPKKQVFNPAEIRLAQQVASGCAIALRQARLHQCLEAQAKALEADFLNTLSHELRTPITSINLAVQTLEEVLQYEGWFDRDRPQVTQLFQILHAECQRESKLINNLLRLTYLDAEDTPMIIDSVDLKTWLPAVVQAFKPQIQQRHQQLYLLTTANLPLLTTDLADLEQILIELLTNACKYTPAGELIILSAEATDTTIQLCISNSGVEIAADEQPKVFDAFYRIPNNNPWQHSGTGLGLALVQKLVERLQASIQVESKVGQTMFKLQFPRTDRPEKRIDSSDRVLLSSAFG